MRWAVAGQRLEKERAISLLDPSRIEVVPPTTMSEADPGSSSDVGDPDAVSRRGARPTRRSPARRLVRNARPDDPDGVDGDPVSTGARGSRGPLGAQLLVTDARTALLLLDHARKRAVVRAFGVRPEHVNAVTAVGLLLIADAAHESIGRLLGTAKAPPPSDGLLAAASIRALVGAVVGPAVDETPGLAALIALALVGHAMRPTAAKSLHAVRTGSHRLSVHFHHRYGYLVDPGHWREQRALAREPRDPIPGEDPRRPRGSSALRRRRRFHTNVAMTGPGEPGNPSREHDESFHVRSAPRTS